MKVFGIVLITVLSILIYMLILGFGNNVLFHQVRTKGKAQTKKIFFISDTHNRILSKKLLRQIEGQVDCIIIGGDFADKRTSTRKMDDNLQALSSIAPTYFVWGNNDEEVGRSTLLALFEKYNVTNVENSSVLLQDGPNKIRLCAVEFHDKKEKYELALNECEPNEAIIFVAHNPQDFQHVLKHAKPLLLMGGHFHGGQIRLGKYSVFPQGSFKSEAGMHTLISNGYGTTLIPLRFGAPAQTHIIEITFDEN